MVCLFYSKSSSGALRKVIKSDIAIRSPYLFNLRAIILINGSSYWTDDFSVKYLNIQILSSTSINANLDHSTNV